MTGTPVEYFNRYTGHKETEAIFGDRWLRWTYDTPTGRLMLQTLIRRAFFSRFYGWLMNRKSSRRRIPGFIETYGIDTTEFQKDPASYGSFNEFFYRKLKPEARPVDPAENTAVFPADGRHLAIADLGSSPGIVAKGQRFDLDRFLRDPALADRYREGSALVSRLCPVDYHRFHFPVAGTAGRVCRIGGWLYSVNPVALRRNLGYLLENRRCYSVIDTPVLGRVLHAEVGATCVGGIAHTYTPEKPVEKGDEKGYFYFGGSCVVLLFEKGRIQFDDDLLANSAQYLETYAKMGDRAGTAVA